MQNMRKGVQIYTVREHIGTQKEYETALKKIADIGYNSIQTYGWKCSDVEHKALLKDFGLTTESVGGDYEQLTASHTDFILATVCEKFGFENWPC